MSSDEQSDASDSQSEVQSNNEFNRNNNTSLYRLTSPSMQPSVDLVGQRE